MPKKTKRFRWIDGKVYSQSGTLYKTKKKAQKMAKHMKKAGYNYRIIKVKGGYRIYFK